MYEAGASGILVHNNNEACEKFLKELDELEKLGDVDAIDRLWRTRGNALKNAGDLSKTQREALEELEKRLGRPSSLPERVSRELPDGDIRTHDENEQARNFFERNRDAARKWWSNRNGGKEWPKESVHDSHPRALKDGGDPLFIEPSTESPWGPHVKLGDFVRWGKLGGFRKNS